MDSSTDQGEQSDWRAASKRRQAWAQSRESVWHDPENQEERGRGQGSIDESGRVPNKISSWLSECRTPLGASLDDQNSSPSRVLRNGCSFEDDLSLGAEANHLQSSSANTEQPCYGLPVQERRSQYKQKGRSMNSTGSGKSSTVSSVSELLDLYEEDPEEILYNLGFGREEPDLASKVPSRFFSSASGARGIDVKVYLGAQLQRMELENPNYALTSRFRQIEVLTTVANEFFQLYSQVSGQPLQRIGSRGGGGGGEEEALPSPLKRNNSAMNAAKILKKTITKHNLLSSTAGSPSTDKPATENTAAEGHAHSSFSVSCDDEERCSTGPDQQGLPAKQKALRKKDKHSLATVTEETNRSSHLMEETERQTDSLEPNVSEPTANGESPPETADLKSTNQTAQDSSPENGEEEQQWTSILEGAPLVLLSNPQLAQLRTETKDSFEMEEVQSNEDDVLPPRTSRINDLLRSASQHSDSSGFAEEPLTDCPSSLKLQESSDSCDSETTVTSRLSHDVATPLALEQPAFDRLVGAEEEEPDGCSTETEEHDGSSEEVLQYSGHQLPTEEPTRTGTRRSQSDPNTHTHNQSDQNMHTHNPSDPNTHSQSDPNTHTHNQSDPNMHTHNPSDPNTHNPSDPNTHTHNQSDPNTHTHNPSDPNTHTHNPSDPNTRTGMEGLCGVSDSSLVQQVLKQASSCHQGLAVPRERRLPLQRSSSLPSSFLSPTRVVSSMRIQFGSGGMAASTPPKYSYQYAYQEEEEEGEQTKCMSTLVIKPASSHTNDHSSCLNMDTFTPTIPKPIPRHLIPSSYCLPSPSPPPDGFGRLLGGYTRSWSTQSVPDLSSDQQQPGHLHQKQNTNQNNHSWRHLTNANANAIASPFPCPCPAQYPVPFQSYPSVPSLHQCHQYPSHPFPHHSSPGILYQPPAPTIPQHSGLTFLHQPTSTTIADQSYIHAQLPVGSYSHTPSPASSYHSYSPHHPPASALGLGLQPGLAHSPAPGGFQTPSSTEMQLRRVLHEVRGLVQSLAQNSADTPSDTLSEPRAALSISQLSLAELQHKRRSLNAFRSHMMDLELSIIRQQALVYTHMSPTDRLQVEQLQALRTAVRDELKDLEYQLEDRLQYTHAMGLHRGGSVDSLSAASALRAMEPVSDLLREQLHLQSELDYEGHTPSAGPSSRSSSPIRTNSGQKSEVYRASINITPAAPPRPITHTAERERFEQDEGGRDEGRRWVEQQQERAGAEGGAGDGVAIGNLQLLIQKIRESVVQEVRREIFNELMDVVSPQRSHSVTTEQPL